MNKITAVLLVLSILSCQKPVDIKAEKHKIQSLMDLVEKAHFNKDANQFYQPNAEEWYDVRKGSIQRIKKSDRISGTQSYLDTMEFHQLVKRDDPIIEISDDGSMASYIGSVTVKGILEDEPVYWVVSWQSVLKKIDNEWKIISTANTEADAHTTAEIVLNQVRTNLGISGDSDIASIYALADCKGPNNSFKTLILSRETDGRMEQVNNKDHSIIKHGKNTSWYYDVNTQSLTESLSTEMQIFARGHELHWLSFKPETRYATPVLKGFTKFQNQTAFHIQFKDNANRPVNFYYAFNSFLPLGFDINTNEKGDLVTVIFKDWEKINGISVFKQSTFIQGTDLYNYNFIDIKINQVRDQDFKSKTGLIK
ncbi:nuclear transport factor 2 family protein [Aquimarina spinulae]|uniref:nuclear transport factor 2 family protein n=1 Tax=Aquimarina spinulae TaxID=1192023 RepID=UPI000D54C6C5|nr:nuclear transport factor 2 family protein [Aquimarina spinulae]